MTRLSPLVALLALALLAPACDGELPPGWEGRYPGACSDGADNDGDQLFDCADPDCYGSPECVDALTDTGDDIAEDAPTDVPTDGSGDVAEDAPTDVPTDGSGDVAEDVPTDVPTDAPTDTPSDVPTDGSGDAADITEDAPTDVPTDGSGDAADIDEEVSCTPRTLPATYDAPAVMLVVDASGSMVSNTIDHDGDGSGGTSTPEITRWRMLRSGLDEALGTWDDRVRTGVQRFPSADACPDATPESSNCYNAGACVVSATPEASVAASNATAVLDALPGLDAGNTEIVGGTPLHDALESAYEHLATLDGDRYAVVVTDGAANCSDASFPDYIEQYDLRVPVQAAGARIDHGIRTVVIGIDIVDALVGVGADGVPEANPHERLTGLVRAGTGDDAAEYDRVTTYDALVDALDTHLGDAATCVWSPPEDVVLTEAQRATVSVSGDSGTLFRVESCATARGGWAWHDDGASIVLCGTTCDAFWNGATFDVNIGCP